MTLAGTDPENAPLTFTVISGPAHGTISGQAPDLIYTPSPNYFGNDAFTYQASNGQRTSPPAMVSLSVAPVNDLPSFFAGPDIQATDENETLLIPGWATAISAGPANEASQQLQFVIQINSNPTLFANSPSIDATGALTVTPAPNTSGIATLTIALQDDGGTANNGIDHSPTQTFRIRVKEHHLWHNAANPVNVDADNEVVADDVLAIINFINARLEVREGEADAPTDNLLELLAANLAGPSKRRK